MAHLALVPYEGVSTVSDGLRVQAYIIREPKVALLWCTECGPMGVSSGRDGAMMAAREHLRTEHGCEAKVEGQ